MTRGKLRAQINQIARTLRYRAETGEIRPRTEPHDLARDPSDNDFAANAAGDRIPRPARAIAWLRFPRGNEKAERAVILLDNHPTEVVRRSPRLTSPGDFAP
jgi:hypothetical protein